MSASAEFSPCRAYRFKLWRSWNGIFSTADLRYVNFIGLNPSTADERADDPTIRRCIAFAKSWGYDGLCMTNLFAFRATDPKVMMASEDPVGEGNDRHLIEAASHAGIVIAAWGAGGIFRGRDSEVARMLPGLHCLGLTKDGQPRHPLYMRADSQPIPCSPAVAAVPEPESLSWEVVP